MSSVSRTLCWLSCTASCVLFGCGLLPKHRTACNNCAPSAIAEVPTTYENYTPPQPVLKPLPAPAVELPSAADEPLQPPPPQTRAVPDSEFDFFEPTNASRPQTNAR